MNKKKRLKPSAADKEAEDGRLDTKGLSTLSLEILCHILDYLPLKDVMKMDHKSKKLHEAVTLHLRVRKKLDFTEKEVYGWMSDKITDKILSNLLSRCRDLEYIQGLHVPYVAKRRTRGLDTLSVPGITEALALCENLKGIELSDIFLLEAILAYLPEVEILGTFKNRIGNFPFDDSNKLRLSENPRITSLHLIGVCIPELPPLMYLKHLQLRWVNLSGPHPFMDFAAPQLQTFVMAHCGGPANSNPLKYVRLITSLATSQNLKRLELIRVPILGGLIQHVVEDSWRIEGFKKINHLKFGACKFILEMDVGYLVITAAPNIEELCLQPSLTKDSLFISLRLADVSFKFLQTLHLGFVDAFPEPGQWTNEDLVAEHLSDVVEHPAMVTDVGMKSVGQCFPELKHVQIYNCPHIHKPTAWLISGAQAWLQLRELYLRRCHAIRLPDFCLFIAQLPNLELLHLEHMFREPPKGCSRVGLSAGTGLGMSSALVGNHQGPNVSDVVDISDDSENENDNNNNELVHQELGDMLDDQGAMEHVPANQEGVKKSSDEHTSRLANQSAEDNILTNRRTDSIETSQRICSDIPCTDHDQTASKPGGGLCEHQADSSEGTGSIKTNTIKPTETGTSVLVKVLPIQCKMDNDETASHEQSSSLQPSSSQQLLLLRSNDTSDTRTPFSLSSSLLSHDLASSRQRPDTSGISHDQIFVRNETGVCLPGQKLYGVSGESDKTVSTCESSSSADNNMEEAMSEMKAEHEIELEEDKLVDEEDAFLLHGEDMADEDAWSDDDQSSDGQDSGMDRENSTLGTITGNSAQNVSSGLDVPVKNCKGVTDGKKDSQSCLSGMESVNSKAQEEIRLSVCTLGKPKHSNILGSEVKMDTSEGLMTENNRFLVADGAANLNCEVEEHQGIDKTEVTRQPTDNVVCPTEVDNHKEELDSKMCDLTNQRQHQPDSEGYGHCQTCNKAQAQHCTDCKRPGYCQSEDHQHKCIDCINQGQGQNRFDSKGEGQSQCNNEGQGQNQIDSKGERQSQCNNEGQGQNEIDSKGEGQSQCNNEGQGHNQIDSKGEGQSQCNNEGQGQNQIDSKGEGQSQCNNEGQGQNQIDSKGEGQSQCNNEGQGQNEIDLAKNSVSNKSCGIATNPIKVTTNVLIHNAKENKQEPTNVEEVHSSLKGLIKCVNKSNLEISKAKVNAMKDEKCDEMEEEEEDDEYSDEDEVDEETVLIVRREEPRGYKVTSEKVDRTEKVIQENNITLSGEVTVRSQSGEISIDPTQGQMAGIVSNVVIMLGMTMHRPKATGTRQLGRDIVVTVAGRSTYVGSGEIDVSIVNGKKIISILQTDQPAGPCETLGDVLRNCGLPSILHLITEGDLREISMEQKLASNVGSSQAPAETSGGESHEDSGHEETNEGGHLKIENDSLLADDKVDGDQNEGHKERISQQHKVIEENGERNITNSEHCCPMRQHTDRTEENGTLDQTELEMSQADKKGCDQSQNQVSNQDPNHVIGCTTIPGDQAPDLDMVRSKSPVQDQALNQDMVRCKSPVQDQALNQDMVRCKSSVQDQALNQDMVRCKSPVQDQAVNQDVVRSKSSVKDQAPNQDMVRCKSPEQDQAPNQDMVRCKSPVQDQALNQDMVRSKSSGQDQAPNQDMVRCKSPVQDQALNQDMVRSKSSGQDQAPNQDMVRCKSPVQDQAPDQDMIRCDCPVRGILHTCSGMVVLLSPCCQMYGNMRIRDAQLSPPIPPSALGAFWSCTVDDPGPSTVADPKLALTKVDNSIQRRRDNDKACQTRATASQSDPSNQVISCLSMGGPTTHNSVGVSTISSSVPHVGSYVNSKRMIDQATSTSDPVIEDDHIQILEIKSKSLTCLSLHMVGITDLVLTDCPKLGRVTGCACRVLKKVKTKSAPKLQKTSFAQCKKLDEEFLLEQITSLSAVKNRVVYLRPLHEFNRACLEKRLFGGHEVDYGLCVVYDYNPSPQDSMYNRTRVATWPNLFIGINLELLQSYNFRQWDGVMSSKYPWDRSIYTMAGQNDNGSRWELITDIPWLRPLSECADLSQSGISTQDKKVGVYCPAAKGHFSVTECLVDLQNDIAEKQAAGLGLAAFSVVVYINMCDVSGVPVHDPYI